MRPVIIIFGAAVRPDGSPSGALRMRVEDALATARELPDPVFMPTGGQGRYGKAEADVMADLLAAGGVDRARIVLEPTARNTLRSVVACRRLMGSTRAPIYVATSGYHMPRCLTLLRLVGLRARPGRLRRRTASRDVVKRWCWRLREAPALPFDSALAVLMRLRNRV